MVLRIKTKIDIWLELEINDIISYDSDNQSLITFAFECYSPENQSPKGVHSSNSPSQNRNYL